LEFKFEILQIYFVERPTSNYQVKCDYVKTRQSYRLFNMTTYRFFSIKKCSSWNAI